MKSELKSIVFERFYIALRDKFFENFIHYDVKRESKEIWKEKYSKEHPKANKNIAYDLFGISNPFYFHRKYDEEAKQHIIAGYPSYPITVDEDVMLSALKYILFGNEFELLDSLPKETYQIYETIEIDLRYNFLLNLFINKTFPEGINVEIRKIQKSNKRGIVEEELFITGLLADVDFFEPQFLKSLVTSYFEAITHREYIKAWDFLSPDFHRNSIWDGEFENFRNSYKNVSSIGITEYSKFSSFGYEYKTASCLVYYKEEGEFPNSLNKFYALNEIQRKKILKEEYIPLTSSYKLLSSYLHKLKQKKMNHIWIRPNLASDLAKLEEIDLRNADFVKAFSLLRFLNLDFELPKKKILYKADFVSRITFRCINNQWKIHKIISKSILETDPSNFRKKLQ